MKSVGDDRRAEGRKESVTHVHDPTVNVAKLLEAKQPRAVSGIIEGEALERDH